MYWIVQRKHVWYEDGGGGGGSWIYRSCMKDVWNIDVYIIVYRHTITCKLDHITKLGVNRIGVYLVIVCKLIKRKCNVIRSFWDPWVGMCSCAECSYYNRYVPFGFCIGHFWRSAFHWCPALCHIWSGEFIISVFRASMTSLIRNDSFIIWWRGLGASIYGIVVTREWIFYSLRKCTTVFELKKASFTLFYEFKYTTNKFHLHSKRYVQKKVSLVFIHLHPKKVSA